MSNNRNIAFWLVLFLLIVVLFNVFSSGTSSLQSREISYSDFVASVERGEVATVILDGENIRFKGGDNVEYVTVRPADTNVTDLLIANQVVVRAEKQEQSLFQSFIMSILPFLLLIGVWIYFMNRMQGGGRGGAMGFGKSRAKLLTEKQGRVTFDDVAGIDEAKEELEELELASKSETFSPTNAYASKTPIIVGSYVNDVGSAVVLNSPLYNISSIGIEVVFQVDATDQETVSLGDSVEIELPTDERVPTVITFIDQVVTQTQAGEFIEVTLEVLNPEEIEAYDQAPVKVFVTTEISENVLYVPVNALLALAEGGYALEVYDGALDTGTFEGESGVDTSYVAVEIGVFTDGFVEVKGNISEGQIVVVPR